MNAKCALNEKCPLKHSPYKTPYLWQYKDCSETSWTPYDKVSNENIEKAFSDPSKTRSGDTCNGRLEVWFQQEQSVHEIHFTNGNDMLYRRLSTESSVTNDSNSELGVTNWKWYWEKSKGVWEEFNVGVSDICIITLLDLV